MLKHCVKSDNYLFYFSSDFLYYFNAEGQDVILELFSA